MIILKRIIFSPINKIKRCHIIVNNSSQKNKKKSYKESIGVIIKTNLIIFLSILLLFITKPILIEKLSFHTNVSKYFIPNTYRLAFVFGTRPEAIKLFPLIKELKENKKFICTVINTGQHREMIKQILDYLNMNDIVDFNLNLMQKNQSLSKLTSKTIEELESIYNLINPNAVIVQGDTTTAFSAAVAAFYQKIPIFHVEAGLRTKNIYYPFP